LVEVGYIGALALHAHAQTINPTQDQKSHLYDQLISVYRRL